MTRLSAAGGRLLRWILGVVVVQALLLALLAQIIPGFRFEDRRGPHPHGAGDHRRPIAALAGHLQDRRPFRSLALPRRQLPPYRRRHHLAAWLDDRLGIGGVEVADLWTGMLVALGLTAGQYAPGRHLLPRRRSRVRPFRDPTPAFQLSRHTADLVPGFLFLEIDGLSVPVLRNATGPRLHADRSRWLARAATRWSAWDPDLSAQTSASQAGILLGSNEGIPAFRWWDKPRQALLVSSQTETSLRALEETALDRQGAAGHVAAPGRWNAFSGNAAENIGVYSVFGDAERGSANTLLGYLLTPYMVARILTLYLIDVVREWWQAWQQRRRNVLPARVIASLKYSFIRAGTTTAMQEASRAILTADLLRGAPAVYNTFFGYDEVAHHSGIDRADSLKVLHARPVFAHLEHVAPRRRGPITSSSSPTTGRARAPRFCSGMA